MKKLSLAYFGSSNFSADFLEKLIGDKSLPIELKFVVTQPDKPVGRKQILTPTPVKSIAQKYKIDCCDSRIENSKSKIKNLDLALVYAYGEIIPADILNLPKYGFWNIHPSLLPRYRGPSPIAYPLLLGDKETGTTIIKLTEKLDQGPILVQEKLIIKNNDKRTDLEKKLTDLSFILFKKTINELTNQPGNKLTLIIDQSHDSATYTRLLTKNSGFISLPIINKAINNEPLAIEELPVIINKRLTANPNNFDDWKLRIKNSSQVIFDYFKGLYPWPGLWTIIDIKGQEKRLKLTYLDLINNKLVIKKVQLEGKKEVDFATFNKAYAIIRTS
jgi:methionyl-tRNA formyltransferase